MSGTLLCSRAEAKELGLKRYFTGNPCKHGHVAERYASTGQCVECMSLRAARIEEVAARVQWHKDNRDNSLKIKKKCRDKNKAVYNARARIRSYENRPKSRANTAKYRASKIKATPIWTDLESIQEIYLSCPAGYHVDHIVPLRGKNVCGLHVPWNLQHLPALENISKNNRFEGGW